MRKPAAPKITSEVLTTFKVQKMQNRKMELLNLLNSTTDENLRNEYESELREIVQNAIKK